MDSWNTGVLNVDKANYHKDNARWLVIRMRQLLDDNEDGMVERIIRAALPEFEREYACQ